ncbi:MAG: DUF3034 family protein [Gammaproteobacteria bacterium]
MTYFLLVVSCASLVFSPSVSADGQLLGTAGATQLEGAGGGGLVPWAVLTGYGTETEWGASASATRVRSDDYTLTSLGTALTWRNRIEVSIARQELDIGSLSGALGIPTDSVLRQNIFGVKVRAVGDLIYGPLPQVSFGAQYKVHQDFAIPSIAGAREDAGYDFYVAASRLLLNGPFGRSLLLNGTLRTTGANQMGLLGFGGDLGERTLLAEASAALLLNRRTVVGVEYRQKPDNLSFAQEDDWLDIFGAYFFNKHLSAVAAYASLGDIATLEDQRAVYVSIQGSF